MNKFNNYYSSIIEEQTYNAGWGRGKNIPVSKKTTSTQANQAGPILGGSAGTGGSPAKFSGSVSAVRPPATSDQQIPPTTAGSAETALSDIYAMLNAAKLNRWDVVREILIKYEATSSEEYSPQPTTEPNVPAAGNTQGTSQYIPGPQLPQVRRAQPVDQQAIDRELRAQGYQRAPGGYRYEKDGSVRRKSRLKGAAGSLSNFLGDVGNTLKRRA
jgi:hypothetical protein